MRASLRGRGLTLGSTFPAQVLGSELLSCLAKRRGAKLPVLSPWIAADLGVPASEAAQALAVQRERRVVKTHTPADGFPIWVGVTAIAVYRHPLHAFFSLRTHTAK